jgi:hypothetical protein
MALALVGDLAVVPLVVAAEKLAPTLGHLCLDDPKQPEVDRGQGEMTNG